MTPLDRYANPCIFTVNVYVGFDVSRYILLEHVYIFLECFSLKSHWLFNTLNYALMCINAVETLVCVFIHCFNIM